MPFMTTAIMWMVSSLVRFFGVQAWTPNVIRIAAVVNRAGIFTILLIIIIIIKSV